VTTPLRYQKDRRDGKVQRRGDTPAGVASAMFLDRALRLGAIEAEFSWPSAKWQKDPVGFAKTIVGAKLWSFQEEFLEAIRDNPFTAVCGGRKIGKDYAIAIAILWWWCCFPSAKSFIVAPTEDHLKDVLWLQLQELIPQCGRCYECKQVDAEKFERGEAPGPIPCPHSHTIDVEVHGPRAGVHSADFRSISGVTAKEVQAVRGRSGTRLFYVFDEAAETDDAIIDSVYGNLAAGDSCRVALISNGTKTTGRFFESFHTAKDSYKTFQVSSEDVPNIKEGREVIPGLASTSWLKRMFDMYGEDSAWVDVHIRGKFAYNEAGKIISLNLIDQAQKRFRTTAEEGRLTIGLDPAGEGEYSKDNTVFALRRGMKIFKLVVEKRLSAQGILDKLLELLRENVTAGEDTPVVCLDVGGTLGAEVDKKLRSWRNATVQNMNRFHLVSVRPSDKAKGDKVYYHLHDVLWGVMEKWLRDGGAIPEDPKLAVELHFASWKETPGGWLQATPKDVFRKELKRSPDLADACCLSVFQQADLRQAEAVPPPAPPPPPDMYNSYRMGDGDPFDALDPFTPR
jgi:hypothetical protein